MTAADKSKLLALAEKWESRASGLHIKPYDEYTPGMVAAYDFAADELRAIADKVDSVRGAK